PETSFVVGGTTLPRDVCLAENNVMKRAWREVPCARGRPGMFGDCGRRAAHRRSLVVAKARKKLEPPLQSGQYPAVRSGAGGRSAVFKATDLLGQMLQSGMSRWTAQRLRHAMAWQIDEQGTGRSGMFPGLAETAPEFRDAEAAGAPDGGSGGFGGGNAMALLGGLAFAALRGSETAA